MDILNFYSRWSVAVPAMLIAGALVAILTNIGFLPSVPAMWSSLVGLIEDGASAAILRLL